ncbi:MAG TPA: hydroxymethylbilane synthase [Patescibacteria group bacterium]|nr:hydroxymethylbilane synthase [Patescibacteria group bacterium]
MIGRRIAIGTRGSALAMVQARLVSEALARDGRSSRIVVVETAGDQRAPDTAWGEGAFVAAIEDALLDGRVDVAVHSAKDVPTDVDPRLRIAAYLARADPRDALVVRVDAPARRLADLPPGSRLGTDSPRRAGFVLAQRPDLVVHPLHGNVDTRLRRLDSGETDALLLACAGLDRLGLADRIAERLSPDILPPAPGQGAIAVQIRSDDGRMLGLTAAIDDPRTHRAVDAERLFLRASGGGCRSPIGALATLTPDHLHLIGGHAESDGTRATFGRRSGPLDAGERLARELATELTARHNADRDVAAVPDRRGGGPPARPGRVLVARPEGQAGELAAALVVAGLEPVLVPAIAIEIGDGSDELCRSAARLASYRWVVVTSANGARAMLASGLIGSGIGAPGWAAIGPATAGLLEAAGIEVGFRSSMTSARALAQELPLEAGDRVLVVRGDLAGGRVADVLRARGAAVDDVIAYRTREAPGSSRRLLRAAVRNAGLDAVVFSSASTVRGLVTLAAGEGLDLSALPAVCIGPETTRAATAAGFRNVTVSPAPAATALATATVHAIAARPRKDS